MSFKLTSICTFETMKLWKINILDVNYFVQIIVSKDAIFVSSKILIICKIRWFVNVKNSMRTSFHWIWWYKMSVIVIDTFVLIQGHKYHTHNCQDLFCFYKTIFCDEICNLMNVYQIALSKLWYKIVQNSLFSFDDLSSVFLCHQIKRIIVIISIIQKKFFSKSIFLNLHLMAFMSKITLVSKSKLYSFNKKGYRSMSWIKDCFF